MPATALQRDASFPSGADGAGPTAPSGSSLLPVPPATREQYIPLSDLLAAAPHAFSTGDERAAYQAAWRWAHDLRSARQSLKHAGQWRVHPFALLPDGRAASALMRAVNRLAASPPNIASAPRRISQRYLDTVELLRRWDALRAEHPQATGPALVAILSDRHGAWARAAGLRISGRTLRRYRDAIAAGDANTDLRGRPRKDRTEPPASPEAWELFRSIFLGSNAIDCSKAWRFVQGEARDKGWSWPGLRTVQQLVREMPAALKSYTREGPRAMLAKHAPKVQRSGTEFGAGETWVLDGRTLDFFCRVPDARRGWRETRLTVTGVMDVRSWSLKVDLRATEHSDGILTGLKAALLDWGKPRLIKVDNGSAYGAALDTDGRVASLCGLFGIELYHAPVKHPWVKEIESAWNRWKEMLDRWLPSFWGGHPEERPEDRAQEVRRRIDELPTEDELRDRILPLALREWHASPIGGDGKYGLTPNLIFEQYRAPVSRIDPALVEIQCRRCIGPVTKTRGGFRLNNIIYGRWDEAVWRLPKGEYFLLKDPERADRVVVCDAQRRPLCEATNKLLTGATEEERREAARLVARYKRIVRAAAPARDYLRTTPVQQILAAKARHAEAREADLRKTLPAPAEPQISIVRPDLAEPARRVLREPVRRAAAAAPERRLNAFDLLSSRSRAPLEDAPEAPLSQAELLRRLSSAG